MGHPPILSREWSKVQTMYLRSHLLFVVLSVWMASLYAGAATTVRGEVSDITGALILQASIGIYSADGDWDTHTDSKGRFAIAGIPPGLYELEVKSPGFIPKLIQNLKVEQTDLSPMNIKLTIGSCPPCCGSSPTCSIADVSYSETDTKPMLKGKVFSMCEESVLEGVNVELYKAGQNGVIAYHPHRSTWEIFCLQNSILGDMPCGFQARDIQTRLTST